MVGCVWFGWAQGEQAVRRWRELDYLRQILLSLKGEVRYGSLALQQVFERIEKRFGDSAAARHCKAWLNALVTDLEKGAESFCELWEKERRIFWEGGCHQEEENRLLQNLGTSLGALDQKQQLEMLTYYLEQLEEIAKTAQEEGKIRSRLYRNLGVLGAAFLMVLLL